MKRYIFALVVLFSFAPVANAQYSVDLDAEIDGLQTRFNDSLIFIAEPRFTLKENEALSNADATIATPNKLTKWRFASSGGHSGTSEQFASNSSIVDELNGTWSLVISDDMQEFEYDVDVSFSLPFESIPYITSSTIVNGAPVGPFDWSLQGGSETFPGPNSQIRARLTTTAFQDIEGALLPFGTTMWTPSVRLPDEAEFVFSVETYSSARDGQSLAIEAIRPVSPNAPSVTFSSTFVTYRAIRQAQLVAPVVPEPTAILTVTGIFLLMSTIRWRARWQTFLNVSVLSRQLDPIHRRQFVQYGPPSC